MNKPVLKSLVLTYSLDRDTTGDIAPSAETFGIPQQQVIHVEPHLGRGYTAVTASIRREEQKRFVRISLIDPGNPIYDLIEGSIVITPTADKAEYAFDFLIDITLKQNPDASKWTQEIELDAGIFVSGQTFDVRVTNLDPEGEVYTISSADPYLCRGKVS